MDQEILKFRLEGTSLVWPGRWCCLACGAEPSRTRRLRVQNVREVMVARRFLDIEAPFCTPHVNAFDRSRALNRASMGGLVLAVVGLGLLPVAPAPSWIPVTIALLFAGAGLRLRILGKRSVLPFRARMESPHEVILEYSEKAPRVPAAPTASENATTADSLAALPAIEPERTTEDGRCWDEVGIPDLLRGITTGNSLAMSALWDEVCHQGTVTSETAAAIPQLVQLTQQAAIKLRPDVLWLLAACASDTRGEKGRPEEPPARSWESRTRQALLRETEAFTHLLSDSDSHVRLAAAMVLAAGQLLNRELRPLVRTRFDQESDLLTKTAILLTLHPIPEQEWDAFVGIFRSASDPLIRRTTAAMVAKSRPGHVPSDVKEHLKSPFRAREDELWDELDPSGLAPFHIVDDFFPEPDMDVG